MDIRLEIVYANPVTSGYYCMYHMARLAAELMHGELVVVESRPLSMVEHLSALLPRERQGRMCLFICPAPSRLADVLLMEGWRKRYDQLAVWVFDSFWTEHVPRFARWANFFDHVFITEPEDIEAWRNTVRAPVSWLPWGSDVLRLGSPGSRRNVDVLRFGRQPQEWEDDQATARDCRALGLEFKGRPPFLNDALAGHRSLMSLLGETKFTVAFSNRVSPGNQTHPNREYITGRWTDSLAAGATVAGMPPHSESIGLLLWPDALLDLETTNKGEGLEIIAQAVAQWTPDRARTNYRFALERLDWRWRFKKIADVLGLETPRLDCEIEDLSRLIGAEAPVGAMG